MKIQELKDLFNQAIPKLGVNDIQKIEEEFNAIQHDTSIMCGKGRIKEVNFYREQIKARKEYILEILGRA